MAFQLSKLVARISVSKHFVLTTQNYFGRSLNLSNKFPNSSRTSCLFHTVVRSSGAGWLNTSRVFNSSPVINTAPFSRPAAVLLGLSAAVIASCVHSSALCAMAAQKVLDVDLDSESTDWKKAKLALLSLSLEDKRKTYKTSHIILDDVPAWKHEGGGSDKPLCEANDELNQKISLFRGDITKLEIDAIANAANKTLLGGGGVDGAIHRGAGPLLRKECSTLGGCETGEAKITGAYRLPARYVIHTVGPIAHGSVGERESGALRDCYYNCLRTATENKLRTVAFPCISTGVYGYPPEQAVEVALKTVRDYLEENHEQIDRVIFCVFLESDEELYKNRLPAYFPQAC